MNKAILIGNLTRDPEVKQTPSGTMVTTFSIAVSRKYKNQDGNYDADFINIVTWRKLAELCGQYLAKGRKCSVIGRIQSRSYEDAAGQRRYITEIVADEVEFLTPKDNSFKTPDDSYAPPVPNNNRQSGDEDFMDLNDTDEIIPF